MNFELKRELQILVVKERFSLKKIIFIRYWHLKNYLRLKNNFLITIFQYIYIYILFQNLSKLQSPNPWYKSEIWVFWAYMAHVPWYNDETSGGASKVESPWTNGGPSLFLFLILFIYLFIFIIIYTKNVCNFSFLTKFWKNNVNDNVKC